MLQVADTLAATGTPCRFASTPVLLQQNLLATNFSSRAFCALVIASPGLLSFFLLFSSLLPFLISSRCLSSRPAVNLGSAQEHGTVTPPASKPSPRPPRYPRYPTLSLSISRLGFSLRTTNTRQKTSYKQQQSKPWSSSLASSPSSSSATRL